MKNTKRKIALGLTLLTLSLVVIGCLGKSKVSSSDASFQKTEAQKKVMYHCPMHPSYISDKPGDCPICGMKLVPINDDQHSDAPAGDANAIRIDPVTVQNMGVTTESAQSRTLAKRIRTGGLLAIDETRQSIVSTKVMGWIENLHVNFTGDRVRKGQPLFDLYSPDLVNTQNEYLQALRYARQHGDGDETGAQELLESTRSRLRNWDIPESEIAALEQAGRSRRTMTFYAPFDGVVLSKEAVQGQNIMPGMMLYRIADISKVWVMANVYQSDLPFVKVGLSAEIELQSQPGVIYKGRIHYVSPMLDPSSKTAQVRVEVQNTSDLALKPEMYANVTIASPAPEAAVSVSEQAVIHSGTRDVVILDLGNGYYRPQEVRLGTSADGYVQILSGLEEGQRIVTSSQFLIDSESNLKIAVGQMSSFESHVATTGTVPSDSALPVPAPPRETGSLHDHAAGSAEYTCTMCPEVKSDKPGKCPKCGMALVKNDSGQKPAQATTYICTMCPEVKSDKPGKCPKCGMFLTKQEQ
jgi:RND family efflux transporter MFP subunit